MMVWEDQIVLHNGKLNDSVILKKEPLDTATKGRVIERVYMTPSESFIFKKFTNDEQGEKEIWIQENILSSFPDFYPKIIAKSTSDNPNNSWIAYRDLGNIKHEFTFEILHAVTKQMVWWHSLPVSVWNDVPLNGQKPKIEEIKTQLLLSKNEITEILLSSKITKQTVCKLFSLLENFSFSSSQVLSHGDLHLGNYGKSQNKLVIFDWEYAHLNTRFWDLYHLIDLSHPLYPKTVTSELRTKILVEYFHQAYPAKVETTLGQFKAEYYLFAATFSVWMMILIQNDLKQNDKKWPIAALRSQLNETIQSFNQCIGALFTMGSDNFCENSLKFTQN